VLWAAPGEASAQQCRVLELQMTPASELQIVAWLETEAGAYVDTVYITNATGLYGIGNRPGILEFNSGPDWPYGRREAVFPVWSHRHGQQFDAVVFQNSTAATERDLSHPFDQSSLESHFCRPLRSDEPGWDTGTCPSTVYTDKGKFSDSMKSRYPPRSDVRARSTDHPDVDMFRQVNPFDTVSRATPVAGTLARLTRTVSSRVTPGNYVLWVEVSKEFDENASYPFTARPGPSDISYFEYGEPYRGQPSVLYKTPITLGAAESSAQTIDYVGYGDPDGRDGNVRAPDATISTTTPGSGALRLALVPDGGAGYRVKVTTRPESDSVAPGAPREPIVTRSEQGQVTITFEAPGDDGGSGRVTEYEVRLRAGQPLDEESFEMATPVEAMMEPDDAGQMQVLTVTGLLPDTQYYVGVRGIDDCGNAGPLMVVAVQTEQRQAGEVDACFVATAAYGSLMANQVEMLRHFRDSMMGQSVLGELAVAAYYTFGPTLAGVVGESELLRSTARTALDPVVRRVGSLSH
jgi:Fibronectin type III domain